MQSSFPVYRFHIHPSSVFFVPGDAVRDALANTFDMQREALCLRWRAMEDKYDWAGGPVEGFTHGLTTVLENSVSATGIPYMRYVYDDDQGELLNDVRFRTLSARLSLGSDQLSSLWVRPETIDARGLPTAEVIVVFADSDT